MKKQVIAIIAYEDNPAVCSSMMMHVDMISEADYSIVMFVRNDVPKSYFAGIHYQIEYYNKLEELPKLLDKYNVSKLWCTTPGYLLKLSRVTNLPIYLWKQGDTAAESFMKHHSYIRKWIIHFIGYVAFRIAKGIIYVSESMKDYYEKIYDIKKNSIIVPCLSEFSDVEIKVDRIPNSFVYIGGLSVWQCFEDTLKLYAKIRTHDSIFHIITLDVETARNKVINIIGDDNNIEIYGIKDRTKIPLILNKFQYGFLIRKRDVVNMVAAPIKFLEYLSCGVNVIMTDAVPSYAKLVKDNHVGTVVDLCAADVLINAYNDQAKKVYAANFDHTYFVKEYRKLLSM